MLSSTGVCTLIALHQVHERYPLIVAANRDELYRRPTSGPRLLGTEPRAIGGVDEEKGGTWLGASEHGFFVGLTNQRSFTLPDARRRSRGDVVLSALAQPGLQAALEFLDALDAREYNGFNLLVGDARELFVAYARPEQARIERHALAPGIWTLPNDRLGSPDFPKIDRAAALAAPLAMLPWSELVVRAREMLADHALPATTRTPTTPLPPWLDDESLRCLDAICVHTPHYGTRSAALLAFSTAGLEHYLYADGPACQSALVPQTDLVRSLVEAS